jgi:polynucleotide 5'-hydroxyl-kinase GRC3/NOL9
MNAINLQISPDWKALDLDDLSGTLLVVGPPDSGKSTFARYLFTRLRDVGRRVAFIDGDPGQSTLGPPTTLTMTFRLDAVDEWSYGLPQVWRYFLGSTTPQGHMLSILVGAARLTQSAQQNGAQVVIYDTSGFVEPARGGLALKNAKLDLLRPSTVFAIQRESELLPFLLPLRRSARAQVIELKPSQAVVPRDVHARSEHRVRQFSGYFSGAEPLNLEWSRIAVYPVANFRVSQLVAIEDFLGFTLGLGIVLSVNQQDQRVRLLTPVRSLAGVTAIRLGDVIVNPETFQDERLNA